MPRKTNHGQRGYRKHPTPDTHLYEVYKREPGAKDRVVSYEWHTPGAAAERARGIDSEPFYLKRMDTGERVEPGVVGNPATTYLGWPVVVIGSHRSWDKVKQQVGLDNLIELYSYGRQRSAGTGYAAIRPGKLSVALAVKAVSRAGFRGKVNLHPGAEHTGRDPWPLVRQVVEEYHAAGGTTLPWSTAPDPMENPAKYPQSAHFKAGYRWLKAKVRSSEGSFHTTHGADQYLKKQGYEGTLDLARTMPVHGALAQRVEMAKAMRQEFLDGAEAAWQERLNKDHPGDEEQSNPTRGNLEPDPHTVEFLAGYYTPQRLIGDLADYHEIVRLSQAQGKDKTEGRAWSYPQQVREHEEALALQRSRGRGGKHNPDERFYVGLDTGKWPPTKKYAVHDRVTVERVGKKSYVNGVDAQKAADKLNRDWVAGRIRVIPDGEGKTHAT